MPLPWHKLKISKAFLLIWEAAPGWAIARLTTLILQATLPLASLYLAKLIIDSLADSAALTDKAAAFEEIVFFLGLLAIVTIITSICVSFDEMINAAQTQRVVNYVETILYRKAIEIDFEYYENSHYQDILSRAQREASYRPNEILRHSAATIRNVVSLLTMVGLLLSLNWGLAGVLLAASIPAMLVRFKYTGIMYRWQRKKTQIQRQTDYFGRVLTSDRFAKEIRLFNIGSIFIDRFVTLRNDLYQEEQTLIRQKAWATLAVQTLSGVMVLSAYGFIIYQTVQGVLKIGDLVLYHQALKRGQQALGQSVLNLSGLHEDNLYLANLYEFLATQSKLVEAKQPVALPQRIQQGIAFNKVSFQYPGSSRVALKQVSLTIQPGETIALVGENGSGKTTLVKLLCRLYDVTSGSITIDNVDIRDTAIVDLHRHISVIFQDYARYNVSALDNIWLGNAEISPEGPEIIAAAQRSGAHDVVQGLEHRYQTILGKQLGKGEELSGGQWQKIALARVFLRDSQIIVLDEPTSAMDPKAEEQVFNQFRELTQSQTAILVTHRLSTVTMADRIYVMSHGEIVEQGTHQELMAIKGTYANLFETQAKNYQLQQ
ncbi:MAG: ABC transporter ATP-binding protein [Cyanobacteria bacterium J06649_4]